MCHQYTLVTSIGEERYFNFARLIQRYVRSFAKSDPSTALQYIYLIGLNGDLPSPTGEEQLDVCWDTIVQLVIETKGYSLVLEQRTADGQVAVRILSAPQAAYLTCTPPQRSLASYPGISS